MVVKDTAGAGVYALSLHDALPISGRGRSRAQRRANECLAGRERRGGSSGRGFPHVAGVTVGCDLRRGTTNHPRILVRHRLLETVGVAAGIRDGIVELEALVVVRLQ